MTAYTSALDDQYAGRRICVTGGAGFIGSHLVDALVARGASVVVLDDLSSGLRENLAGANDRIEFVEGSIADVDAVQRAVAGVEIVFHQAALTSVPRSVEHPRQSVHVNTAGAMKVLSAAHSAGVQRVVLASSSSVYGDQEGEAKVETMFPQPRSPYAAAKLAAEHCARAMSLCCGLSTVCLRYFNIFGPRQRPDSQYAAVIPRFIEAMRSGSKPVIFGDGSQTRDFTFVANVVQANLRAGVSTRKLRGEAVNIACGGQTALLDLTQRIADLLDVEYEFERAPARKGEVLHSRADITLASKLLDYTPTISFAEGLQRTVQRRSAVDESISESF